MNAASLPHVVSPTPGLERGRLRRVLYQSIGFALLLVAGCASTTNPVPVRESSFTSRHFLPAPAGYYRIQGGDTLVKIAFQHGLDFRDLAAWNNLSDPSNIIKGNLLRLTAPKVPSRTAPIASKPKEIVRAVAAPTAFETEAENDLVPDSWNWPSQGPILARYGSGLNKGIDIGGPRGQSIQAAANGRVVYAGSSLRGYGKLIIIRHGKTLLSAYAHNSRILVADGQMVVRGQSIAEMGDTDADQVKLHFEIREHGKPVDPLNYLPKQS
jgi:lipoprotein NlpD